MGSGKDSEAIVEAGSRLLRDPRDQRLSIGSPGEVRLLGVPWDWSVSGRPGSRFAPQRIRSFLYSMTPHAPGVGSDFTYTIEDLGDVNVAPGDHKLTFKRIRASASKAYNARLAVFLGGDHSITRWTVEPLAEEELGILVLDAHYDLRVVSEGLTSGSWLGELLEQWRGRVEALVIGVADYLNPPYLESRASELGVRVIPLARIIEKGVEEALEAIDRLAERGFSYYYISIDMDHLGEAWAPGVNAPSPLGLDPQSSMLILREAASKLKPRGIDVVEVAPPYDVGDRTSRLAAALLLYVMHSTLR